MTGSRSLFAAASLRTRRLMVRSVALIALSVAFMVARVVEYFTGAPLPVGDVTAVVGVGSSLALIRTGVVMRRVRLAEAAETEAEQARRVEFLRLRAPAPAAGQCPVCALDDLDVLAERDRELELDATPLARVVAYGPDRAHQECNEAVPYTPPVRSTSGGTRIGYHAAANPGGCSAPRCRPCAAKRGRLRESFIEAMAEEAVALGETLQRELGLQSSSVRASVAAQMDARLTWAGSHSWESWQEHGFGTRAEAAAWYRLGFTPWRARNWRQAGFTDPEAVARTGCTWPVELRGRD